MIIEILAEIVAGIGALVLILQAATRVPAALAEFVRACGQVLDAVRELRTRYRGR